MATLNQIKQILLSLFTSINATHWIHLKFLPNPFQPPCVAAMRASKKASNLALESSSKLVTSAFAGFSENGNKNPWGKVLWWKCVFLLGDVFLKRSLLENDGFVKKTPREKKQNSVPILNSFPFTKSFIVSGCFRQVKYLWRFNLDIWIHHDTSTWRRFPWNSRSHFHLSLLRR